MKSDKTSKYGDEPPRLKDFIIVLVVTAILMALSWIAYYKLGWFH